MNRHLLTDGSERRAAPRKVLRTNVEVRPAGSAALQARSVDISLSGMGFICGSNLPARSACQVGFTLMIDGEPVTVALKGTVAYTVLSAQQGGFMVGLKFDPLPAEVSKIVTRYMNA